MEKDRHTVAEQDDEQDDDEGERDLEQGAPEDRRGDRGENDQSLGRVLAVCGRSKRKHVRSLWDVLVGQRSDGQRSGRTGSRKSELATDMMRATLCAPDRSA